MAAQTDLQVQQHLAKNKPAWDAIGGAKGDALKLLDFGAPAAKNKAILSGNVQAIDGCFEALKSSDDTGIKWMLTVMYDMLREDASCFSIFEDALKAKIPVYNHFHDLIDKHSSDAYICKKAAWILSSIIGFLSRFFRAEDVTAFSKKLTSSKDTFTELGVVEAVLNLLKSDTFRPVLWKEEAIQNLYLEPFMEDGFLKHAEPDMIHKVIFAIWLLSLDPSILEDLQKRHVPKRLKDIIATCRVEKIVRISLIALEAVLANKQVCEDVVEAGVKEAVENLEFEKWRDAELYDEIRKMNMTVANHVAEFSNFARYENELHGKKLRWGFIHTSKFWGENVMKFEQNDFKAVRELVHLLDIESFDHETVAVACHDLGEFVALHPLGKKQIMKLASEGANYDAKAKVMKLMQAQGEDEKTREVRREALLCCQKIMLNKWQDIEKAKA